MSVASGGWKTSLGSVQSCHSTVLYFPASGGISIFFRDTVWHKINWAEMNCGSGNFFLIGSRRRYLLGRRRARRGRSWAATHSFCQASKPTPAPTQSCVCVRGKRILVLTKSQSNRHQIEQVVAAASALICQPSSAGITGIRSDSPHALNTRTGPGSTANNYESNLLKKPDIGIQEQTQQTHSPFTSDEDLQKINI